jgi:hypothetical protein
MAAAVGLGLLLLLAFLLLLGRQNSSRVGTAFIWTALWILVMSLMMGLFFLGDCMENIDPNWPDTSCSVTADIARPLILLGGPTIWLGVLIFLFRSRSR